MTPSISQIQERACEVFGFTLEELIGTKKKMSISRPRFMLMRYCRELGYRADAIEAAFRRKQSMSSYAKTHFNDASFTELEHERMEQVKASFKVKIIGLPPVDFEHVNGQWVPQVELERIRKVARKIKKARFEDGHTEDTIYALLCEILSD